LELKEEHQDPGEGQTREGIKDLLRIPGVGNRGPERGKNHQRNGGGCRSEHGSTLVVLPALFLAGQKLLLGLGYFCRQRLEKFSFLYPFLHLRAKFLGDLQGSGAVLFLLGQQRHFMKGTLLRASAPGVATPFFGNIKGGLKKGLYLSEALQRFLPLFIGPERTRHIYMYIYFTKMVKKNAHCEKIFAVFRVR